MDAARRVFDTRAVEPIVIETVDQMLEHGNRLEVYCRPCDRWTVVDLAGMSKAGRGNESMIRRHWICKDCSARGELLNQAPAPGSPGYKPHWWHGGKLVKG